MIESKARTVARTYINVNSFNYLDWLDFNPRVFPRRAVWDPQVQVMDPRQVHQVLIQVHQVHQCSLQVQDL